MIFDTTDFFFEEILTTDIGEKERHWWNQISEGQFSEHKKLKPSCSLVRLSSVKVSLVQFERSARNTVQQPIVSLRNEWSNFCQKGSYVFWHSWIETDKFSSRTDELPKVWALSRHRISSYYCIKFADGEISMVSTYKMIKIANDIKGTYNG